jgi:hypothetical protein
LAPTGFEVAHRVSVLSALFGGLAAAGLFRALAVSLFFPFSFFASVRDEVWGKHTVSGKGFWFEFRVRVFGLSLG